MYSYSKNNNNLFGFSQGKHTTIHTGSYSHKQTLNTCTINHIAIYLVSALFCLSHIKLHIAIYILIKLFQQDHIFHVTVEYPY